jgi:hypothetical protein
VAKRRLQKLSGSIGLPTWVVRKYEMQGALLLVLSQPVFFQDLLQLRRHVDPAVASPALGFRENKARHLAPVFPSLVEQCSLHMDLVFVEFDVRPEERTTRRDASLSVSP